VSVVAWDGKTLVADRMGSNNGLTFTMVKMQKFPDGTVLAWCGIQEQGLLLAKWFREGADPEKWPAFQKKDEWTSLLILKDGKLTEYEQEPIAQEVLDPRMAWGHGRAFALGAMAAGASAVEAVTIASTFDIYCGNGVSSSDG